MIEQKPQSLKMQAARWAVGAALESRRRRREEFRQEVESPLAVWQPEPPVEYADDGEYFRAERTRPVRPPSVGSDVITPLLQAAVFGGLAWAGVSVLAEQYRVMIGGECLTALVATGLAYGLSVAASRKTMWVTEVIERGVAVERTATPVVQQAQPPIQLEVTQRDERGVLTSIQRFNLPGEVQGKLPGFAAGVLAGRGLAVDGWTGRGAPFSRAEYNDLLAALEAAGIVRWRSPGDPKQGRELTTAGRSALREMAKMG